MNRVPRAVPARSALEVDRRRNRGRPSGTHVTCGPSVRAEGLVDDAEVRGCLPAPRVACERPARLIQIDAVAKERTSQHSFLHHAELLECAVPASVLDGRFGFHAMNADYVEREVE